MSPAEHPDRLDHEKLRSALSGLTIGNHVVVLEETTSTNDVVAQLAPARTEGLVVFAERQTAGRGQYGRRWESLAHNGLWLSVLLRPRISVAESSKLTDLLAQTIAATVAQVTGATASIKQPNDVLLGGRKIAGVLVEMRVEASGGYCAIAGMGVNVNHGIDDFADELRATAGSIAMFVGRPVDRHAFAIALLRQLDAAYREFSESSATRATS